jgi:hypothetical protein
VLSVSLVAWAFGAAPSVAQLLDHGVDGQRAAIVLGVVALGTAAVLASGALGRGAEAAVVVFATAIAGWVTAPTVGRAPVLVTMGAVVMSSLACSARVLTPWTRPFARRSVDGVDRSRTTRAVATLPLLALWSSWYQGASVGASLAWITASALLLLVARPLGLTVLDRALGRVGSGVGAVAAEVGKQSRPLVAAGDRLLRGGARTAASLGRWTVRSVVALVVWLADRRHRPIVACGLIGALATAPIFRRTIAEPWIFIRGTNDVPGTIDRVHWMSLVPFRLPVPHPGWSIAVKVLLPLVGEVAAVTIILAVATGAAVAVLMTIGRGWWDRRPPLSWPLAAALGLSFVFLENPAVLVPAGTNWWNRFGMAGEFARGPGFLPFHQWATPTITMSMPLVFALFAMVLMVLDDVETASARSRAHRRALALLTVVSTLVQPATTLALLPALPVLLLLTRRFDRPTVRALGWSFVVPGATVCLGQVVFLASKVSPWEQATWHWRPFWTLEHFGLDRPVLWLTVLFYPLCIWVGGRRYVSDRAVQLSFLAAVISWVPFFFLEQTTIAHVPDGDLGVMPMMSMVLLFFASLRFVLLEVQELWRSRAGRQVRLPPWTYVVGGFLVLMACAGVVELFSAAGVIQEI